MGALRGLLTTVVFSPQQGFEAAPQASASVCQGCRSRPRASPPRPPHLPLIHCQPWLTGKGRGGGGGGGPGWPCSDPSPPGPGTPLTVLNGPILALDADLDVYAVVTYQLLGAQSGLFDIDNSTGEAAAHPALPPAHLSQLGQEGAVARSRASPPGAGLGHLGQVR